MVFVLALPLLARALLHVDAAPCDGWLRFAGRSLAAAVGGASALATVMVGVGVIGIDVATAAGGLEYIPVEAGAAALMWLGAVLAVDLGLSSLFTRPLPWRSDDRLVAALLLPGVLAVVALCGLVGGHPAHQAVPDAIAHLGLPALALLLGVALLGPLRPATRRACQLGGLAAAAVVAVGAVAHGSLELAELGALFAWHAAAGPVEHRLYRVARSSFPSPTTPQLTKNLIASSTDISITSNSARGISTG